MVPSRLYMFRAMFSPIIRSTWLYLQCLVVFTQVAAVWCPEWVQTELSYRLVDRMLAGYMFRAMFSPIIRSIWLYLQDLVVFTQVAAAWCPEWVKTELSYRLVDCMLAGYLFRAMFSPIIRSIWLYLQDLVVFTQVAAGCCPEWVETELSYSWLHASGLLAR